MSLLDSFWEKLFHKPEIRSAPCHDPDHFIWVDDGWDCPICSARENLKQARIKRRIVRRHKMNRRRFRRGNK